MFIPYVEKHRDPSLLVSVAEMLTICLIRVSAAVMKHSDLKSK